MKVLLFAGSLRKDSLNKKLLSNANQIIQGMKGFEATVVDLQVLNLPVYDGDLEKEGTPKGVHQLGNLVSESDAIIIATPEYNGSISSPLKNTIDWVSRLKPMPWDKKPVLLIGASPGGLGAMPGLLHSKVPFEKLGSYVYPTSFGVPKAHEAFSDNNQFKDAVQNKKLSELISAYLDYAKKLTEKK